jgi:flagellar basal-body rod protein FlgF
MENATTIALSRMIAQQRALDLTATNIANASTPGFHAERMLFSDFLVKQPGGKSMAYTQDRSSYRETQPGTFTHTANPLDLAIGAPGGYFTVQGARGPRLTRAGHFELSSKGQIVDDSGEALLSSTGQPIQVATADTNLTVAGDGTLSSENGQIAKIGVVTPTDAQKLQGEGGLLLDATGTPTTQVAAPQLVQGAVEDSNVQPTVELTRMMNDVREFQFASQFVQGEADRQQSAIDKITQKRT